MFGVVSVGETRPRRRFGVVGCSQVSASNIEVVASELTRHFLKIELETLEIEQKIKELKKTELKKLETYNIQGADE